MHDVLKVVSHDQPNSHKNDIKSKCLIIEMYHYCGYYKNIITVVIIKTHGYF